MRRSRFELNRRRARLHIVEGLLKALDVLDEVIDTIRRSRTADTARTNLMKKFGFTELQATAILDMQLRRLAALERRRLAEEEKELRKRIRYLEGLLRSEAKRLAVVIEETTALKEKFAVPRRTVILDQEGAVASSGVITTEADLVMPEGSQVLVITPERVQRADANGFSYRASRSMTKGAVRDVHLAHIRVEPNDEIILLTNRGRGWRGTVGFIPPVADSNALGLPSEERVVDIAVLQPDTYLVMGTQGGKIKRTKVGDLSLTDRTWDIVMGMSDEGKDELLFGKVVGDGAHIFFYTVEGQLLRIDGDTVNPQQTGTATGVVGISLNKGDRLKGGTVVPNATSDESKYHVVVISERGYAHRAHLAEFSVQGRGARGVRCLRPTKSGGNVGGVAVARRGTIDVYLGNGRRQRLDLKGIPEGARGVRGERLVDVSATPVARIVNLS